MSVERHDVQMRLASMTKNTNGTRNQVLQRLDASEFRRLQPSLQAVELSFKELLYEQGKPIPYMFFVESGVVSLVTDLKQGGTIETGTIGNESVVGIPAFFGAKTAAGRAFCQIPGRALRVKLAVMATELARNTPLSRLVLRVADATMSMLAQTAACNRAHPVEERMARWLLMTHDRVEGDEFPLTQEFLAQMLGARRPSVNTAGLALQEAGLIRYSRGKIRVLNSEFATTFVIEATSRECGTLLA